LKAALVYGRVRPRKTHDLAALADEVTRLLPSLAPLADPLRPWGAARMTIQTPRSGSSSSPDP
jgi:hypothetical protein